MIKCDFCVCGLKETTATSFAAGEFTVVLVVNGRVQAVNMQPRWAACPMCAMLILASRWDELKQRSAEGNVTPGVPKEISDITCATIIDEFRRNML